MFLWYVYNIYLYFVAGGRGGRGVWSEEGDLEVGTRGYRGRQKQIGIIIVPGIIFIFFIFYFFFNKDLPFSTCYYFLF